MAMFCVVPVYGLAAVSPAANCAPPSRLAEVMIATAPTPRASVDNPTSVVNTPQMMKRMPRKSR